MSALPAPHRLQIRINLHEPLAGGYDGVIPIFHRWIQEGGVEDVLIDVADYKHVPDGPGVLLIGHKADLAYDEAYGKPSIRYQRKRQPAGSLQLDLQQAFDALMQAIQRLDADAITAIQPKLNDIEITLLDRLAYPNQADGAKAASAATEAALTTYLSNTASVRVAAAPVDSRLPLTLQVQITHAPTNAVPANEEAR